MISMICSVGRNNELGKGNKLIWHIPKDMKFFKEMTMGHVVVMGRKTYESLPGDLPGRKMVVLSSSKKIENVTVVSSIEEVLDKYKDSSEEVFIIGGNTLYKEFIKYANKMYLTEIDDECNEADTYFPKFDKSKWNKKIIYEDVYKDINFKMCEYIKK